MRKLFTVLFVLATAMPAYAQDSLIVADASSSGTYKAMLQEIIETCSPPDGNFHITEANVTGGATDNLEALKNNQASAAFMHSDVIYAATLADPSYKQLKVLATLYPEEIHVLALRNSKTIVKSGGVGGFFQSSTTVQFGSLADLAGYSVGAAGGGVITAKVLTGQGEGHFNVKEYPDGKSVIAGLDSGEIAAAIFVGGAPLPNISPLKSDNYKLLPIPDSIANHVSGVYSPATINYRNLNSGVIKTLAPTAVIMTRSYSTAKMIAPQARFRQCFYASLDEMKETPGKHPKWQQVDPNKHEVSGVEWYNIPNVGPITRPAPKK